MCIHLNEKDEVHFVSDGNKNYSVADSELVQAANATATLFI